MQGFGKSAENIQTWIDRAGAIESFGKTTVYEQNADKLGRLTPDEVDAIVSYYSHLEHMHQLLQAHENDAVDATTAISESLNKIEKNQKMAIKLMKEEYGEKDTQPLDIELNSGKFDNNPMEEIGVEGETV